MNAYLRIPAPNVAKEHIDALADSMGFRNVAVSTSSHGSVARFFAKLASVLLLPFRLHRGDVLLIQYPFKKYYPTLCRLAHLRGAVVVTLIHDLGCFRRKKLTVRGEVRRLSATDALIVHNDTMRDFLVNAGLRVPIVPLRIFDYLAPQDSAVSRHKDEAAPWTVVYAGGLVERKSTFLYMADAMMDGWQMELYGRGLNEEKAATWKHIHYGGFRASDDFIRHTEGHFGLVWDGDSLDECAGAWGEYLKVNNPHKTSFYLRAGMPVILWSKAALAPFVRQQGVGICVDSLRDVGEALRNLTPADYRHLTDNVQTVARQLADGYYFRTAFAEAARLAVRAGHSSPQVS